MSTWGLGLEEFFERLKSNVQRESSSKQVPWDSSSVTVDFLFVSMEAEAPVAPAVNSDEKKLSNKSLPYMPGSSSMI